MPSREAAEAVPYPAIWHNADPSVPLRPSPNVHTKAMHPVIVPTMAPAAAAHRAVAAAAKGVRVLIIRNTVDAAVETWRSITAARPDLCFSLYGRATLHHSRFAAEDRSALDTGVEEALGRGADGSGVILIGTQILEQSLDIDADLLITDLCPMDVLLQRIGRLHRHPDRVWPAGFEAATHPDALAKVETEMDWMDYAMRIDAKALAEGRAGGIVALHRAARFPSAFPDADEAIQTRLGARGPGFTLPKGTVGPFGMPITTVAPQRDGVRGLQGTKQSR